MSSSSSEPLDQEPSRPTIGPGDPATFWMPDAIPSATVIVLRDCPDGSLETLMLKRDAGLTFAGGMWVFPGGRIDADDLAEPGAIRSDNDPAVTVPGENTEVMTANGSILEQGSLTTAIRETAEETGLVVEPHNLRRWSHWTAPVETPRRFTTAFYVTVVSADLPGVVIDDSEIREFRWMSPTSVIKSHSSGELGLTPPTFITLSELATFSATSAIIDSLSSRTVEHFATRFGFIEEQMIAMYHGDAGYEDSDPTARGLRHRLTLGQPWSYERDT